MNSSDELFQKLLIMIIESLFVPSSLSNQMHFSMKTLSISLKRKPEMTTKSTFLRIEELGSKVSQALRKEYK